MATLVALLIFGSMATGFVSFVALFKPFPQESFFTRKRVVVVWVASFVLFGVGGLLRPVPSLGPFFMLVSIVAGTFSFIALFRPLPQIWLPTRKRAAVVWAASFALVALGGSLMSDLEEAETRLAAELAAEAAQAEAQAAEDEARLAEDARLAAAEERARLAAESFPTRREDFEQRLDELEGIINDEAWVRAKNDGEALQQELSPLFRSSIADTPEVTSIRTRLDDALAVARKEENVVRRQEERRQQEITLERARPRDQLALLSMRGGDGGYGFHTVEGQVQNVTDGNIENVMAVVTWFTGDDQFITTDEALIDYNPILPGQTSPFEVMSRTNPAMQRFRVEFKTLFGGTLRHDDHR